MNSDQNSDFLCDGWEPWVGNVKGENHSDKKMKDENGKSHLFIRLVGAEGHVEWREPSGRSVRELDSRAQLKGLFSMWRQQWLREGSCAGESMFLCASDYSEACSPPPCHQQIGLPLGMCLIHVTSNHQHHLARALILSYHVTNLGMEDHTRLQGWEPRKFSSFLLPQYH